MKILFQEPFIPDSVTFGKFAKGAGNNTFPCGLASIATYVKDRGYDVSYLDPNIINMSEDSYLFYLQENQIDLIGISSTTLQIQYAVRTFELIKKRFPEMITVIGGIHPSLMPIETVNCTDAIDYIFIGEGEKTFCQFVEYLKRNDMESIGKIEGICYKKPEMILNTFNDAQFLRPREIPIPLYEIFPMSEYIAQISYSKDFPSYSVIASRGCPFKCSFCNANITMGNKTRYKPVLMLLEEIRLLKDKYGAKGIMFLDSTFTINKKWVREFCHEYQKADIGLAWACNSRVDTVDRELLSLMKDAGCWSILYGIESANQKSLELINKGTTVQQNTDMVLLSMELGFYVYTSYIICLPGENENDVISTINYARNLGNPMAMFYLPIPFPKTELWRLCKEMDGLRDGAEWEAFNAWNFDDPVYINPLIGRERMQQLLRRAFLRFYSNPIVWYRNLKEVLLFNQSPYRYWMGLRAALGFFQG